MRWKKWYPALGFLLLAVCCRPGEALRASALVLQARIKAEEALKNPPPVPVGEGGEEGGGVNGTEAGAGGPPPGPKLTGIPQKDYIHDPNLPRELKGHDLSTYPFYNAIPPDIEFECDGLHDGFYASVPHHCQVYHHCLFGTRYDFLCANYTAFDQKTFICHFVSEVDCNNSPKYYKRNEALYKQATTPTLPPTTSPTTVATTAKPTAAPKASGGGRAVGGGARRRRPYRRRRPVYEYYYDDEEYEDEDYMEDSPAPAARPRPRSQQGGDEPSAGGAEPATTTATTAAGPTTEPPLRPPPADIYKPRVLPKIRRPVPLNERDKYDYTTSSSSAVASSTGRPSKGQKEETVEDEDEYYDDEYEDEEEDDFDDPDEPRGMRGRRPHYDDRRRKPQRRRNSYRKGVRDEDDMPVTRYSGRSGGRKRYHDMGKGRRRRPYYDDEEDDYEYYEDEEDMSVRGRGRAKVRGRYEEDEYEDYYEEEEDRGRRKGGSRGRGKDGSRSGSRKQTTSTTTARPREEPRGLVRSRGKEGSRFKERPVAREEVRPTQPSTTTTKRPEPKRKEEREEHPRWSAEERSEGPLAARSKDSKRTTTEEPRWSKQGKEPPSGPSRWSPKDLAPGRPPKTNERTKEQRGSSDDYTPRPTFEPRPSFKEARPPTKPTTTTTEAPVREYPKPKERVTEPKTVVESRPDPLSKVPEGRWNFKGYKPVKAVEEDKDESSPLRGDGRWNYKDGKPTRVAPEEDKDESTPLRGEGRWSYKDAKPTRVSQEDKVEPTRTVWTFKEGKTGIPSSGVDDWRVTKSDWRPSHPPTEPPLAKEERKPTRKEVEIPTKGNKDSSSEVAPKPLIFRYTYKPRQEQAPRTAAPPSAQGEEELPAPVQADDPTRLGGRRGGSPVRARPAEAAAPPLGVVFRRPVVKPIKAQLPSQPGPSEYTVEAPRGFSAPAQTRPLITGPNYRNPFIGGGEILPQVPPSRGGVTAPGPSGPTSLDLPEEEEYDVTLNDALQPSTLHPAARQPPRFKPRPQFQAYRPYIVSSNSDGYQVGEQSVAEARREVVEAIVIPAPRPQRTRTREWLW